MRRTWFPILGVLLAACCLLLAAGAADAATLTWRDNADNESGFHVHRAPKACSPAPADTDYTKVGEVGPNVRTYVDSTTQTGNRYCYRVRAWNLKFLGDPESAQYSTYSNLAVVEYPLPASAAPDQLVGAP